MRVEYLEIVTTDVDATCSALETLHGVQFGCPVTYLGSARVVELEGGGSIGVREPISDYETPIVRSYLRVPDLKLAVKQAIEAGAVIDHTATDVAGLGEFAIFTLGGIQHGLWQVD